MVRESYKQSSNFFMSCKLLIKLVLKGFWEIIIFPLRGTKFMSVTKKPVIYEICELVGCISCPNFEGLLTVVNADGPKPCGIYHVEASC